MSFASIRIVIAGIDEFSKTINKSLKGIKKMGQSINKIGRQLTLGLSLPLLAFGALTLSTAANFESSMNTVQNLTQATTSEFREMQLQARSLGATTAFTASQAADAMGILGLAGLDTNEILASTGSVLNMAAAGNIEMSESAEILTGVMAGFNIAAEESTFVTDLLVTTMQSAKTDLTGIGEAMSFVSPMARSMNVSIKDTALAIGLLSNANIKGARAGTTFRAILAGLIKPTKEGAATLEKLKIPKSVIFDAKGDFISLTDTIEAFRDSGANASDMISIFGRKMGIGMSAMVGQSTEKIGKLVDKLNNVKDTAKIAAEVQLKGLNGQLKILKSSFQELQLSIADSGLLAFASKIVTKLAGFIRKLATLNPKILKLGTIIAGLAITLGPLLFLIGGGLIIFAKFAAAITAAGGVIALLSNPIGWAIAGIMALIGLITFMSTHADSKITKIITSFFPLAGVMTWIITRWQRILPFFKLFFLALGAMFKLLWVVLKPILLPIAKFFEWLGDIIFKTLDVALTGLEKLTQLVLPKWLEDKIGLQTEITGGDAAGLQNRLEETKSNNRFESKATIRFENAPPGMNIQSIQRGLSFETDTGALIPEAG